MLVWLSNLIHRRCEPRSRADELFTLRARLSAQPGRWSSSAEEIAVAEELKHLKIEAAQAFGQVRSCGECALQSAPPKGPWQGGRCCGTSTDVPFCADEMAALKLAGTRSKDLRPPSGAHAGCAFRTESGCALPPVHRPSLCLEYACAELKDELRCRGDWQRIQSLREALYATYERFVILRAGHPSPDRNPITLVVR